MMWQRSEELKELKEDIGTLNLQLESANKKIKELELQNEAQRLEIQGLKERNATLDVIIGNFPSLLETEELSEEEEKTTHEEWLQLLPLEQQMPFEEEES